MPKLYSGQKIIKALNRAVAVGTFQSVLKQAAMEFEELRKYIR